MADMTRHRGREVESREIQDVLSHAKCMYDNLISRGEQMLGHYVYDIIKRYI